MMLDQDLGLHYFSSPAQLSSFFIQDFAFLYIYHNYTYPQNLSAIPICLAFTKHYQLFGIFAKPYFQEYAMKFQLAHQYLRNSALLRAKEPTHVAAFRRLDKGMIFFAGFNDAVRQHHYFKEHKDYS